MGDVADGADIDRCLAGDDFGRQGRDFVHVKVVQSLLVQVLLSDDGFVLLLNDAFLSLVSEFEITCAGLACRS